ncbi:DUF1045 domain-containing protein [Pseudodesulfovibrio cashew]|nr:DUF1045 domain-containing protein [Pseudodesulfovibrio cashew]
MAARYGVYYAPEEGSELEQFGSRWLGRSAATGREIRQPGVPGLDREIVQILTQAPRLYGFHGTLVPPFPLCRGCSSEDFRDKVAACARNLAPIDLGPLELRVLGSFLALVPAEAAGMEGLRALHETCLLALHPFREPPSKAEMARRRARGLTPTQDRLLVRFGYPYVLEEYRFHLTLTDAVPDRERRAALLEYLEFETRPLREGAHPVRELCLFRQESPGEPFTIVERFPMGKEAEG